jgi:ATP-dependent DNA helicase PIF1
LKGPALENLQNDLALVQYIIIDEISMVGAKFFNLIDRRLRQVFSKPSTIFGGCNLILVGDPKQLPPVGDTELWDKRSVSLSEHSLLGMCSFDEIDQVIILKTIVRQNDPKQQAFRELLNRLRVGKSTLDDYELLKPRIFSLVTVGEQEQFLNATRLYPSRKQVSEHNLDKLARLNSGLNPQKTCRIDAIHTPANLEGLARRQRADDMMGLESSILVARGARIMVTQNVWTEMGITNGSTGVIKHIIYAENMGPPNLPEAIIIQMDDDYLGPHIEGHPRCIALNSVMSYKESEKGSIERTQFPISLAFAVTVHKTQG